MPGYYTIDRERRLVISTATGDFTDSDLVGHEKVLRKDTAFDPSFDQLADFTGVTKVEITSAGLKTAAELHIFSAESRRAIVVASNEIFGLARMFQTFRDLSGGRERMEIFRNRDEALRWLGHPPALS